MNERTLHTRFFSCTTVLLGLITAALLNPPAIWASNARISALIGHPVETDTGESLGNVEDLAFDPATGQVSFVVISIGSFLVENSLIAVQPSALAPVAKGKPIVLRTEDLEVAHRFNADNWPTRADVRPAGAGVNTATGAAAEETSQGARTAFTSGGSATITAGRKKATFEDGKREIINGPIRRATTETKPRPAPRVIPNFKNLDRNRDGRLSRAEIGAQLNQKSGFADLDVDANGTIDDFEYAAYLQRIASERRWEGNR